MFKFWVVLGVMCLALFASAQEMPKNGSKTYSVPNSNGFVDYSWTWEERGHSIGYCFSELMCGGVCQGAKHFTHAQCDSSCDTACEWLHKVDVSGQVAGGPYPGDMEKLQGEFQRFGMNNVGAKPTTLQVMEEILPKKQLESISVTVQSGCWEERPCMQSLKFPNSKTWYCTFTVSMYRITPVEGGAPVRTQGPVVTFKVTYWIPIGGFADRLIDYPNCKCEILVPDEDLDDHSSLYFPDNTQVDPLNPPTGVASGMTRPLTGQELGGCEFAISHESMNYANLTCTGAPEGLESITIPAGYELECTQGNGQNTILADDCTLVCTRDRFGRKSWQAVAPVRVRTLCLEIDSPEPNSRMTYELRGPSTPGFAYLARIARDSRFRGPWDQTRMWIATDLATYDEIYEKLLPPPAQREYVRELKIGWSRLAIALSDPEAWKLVRREFLLEGVLDATSAEWVMEQHYRRDPRGTVDFLRKNTDAVEHVISQRDGVAHIAAMARTLAELGDTESALWLITEATPADFRGDLVATEAGEFLAGLLVTTTDAGVAGRILSWIELKPSPVAQFFAGNVNPRLPEGIRERAMKVAAPMP